MNIKFKDYELGYKIVSLALDKCERDKLTQEKLALIYVDSTEGTIVLLPDGIVLSRETAEIERIKEFNSYDVFELWENGVLVRKYNDTSEDNYFFITGKCNSNCIMCPSSEYSRKNSFSANLTDLLELAEHIPSDVSHMTITGGEPFLMGEQIFPFLQFLKKKFIDTEFLFLTNGRIFAIDKYIQMFCETTPNNSIVAIPVHGSCEQIHDAITRTDGSFKQTLLGVKRLLKNKIPVEVRLVVNKLNVNDFDNIAQLIIKQLKGIEYVSVIAMEMTGTAKVNQEQVWIPYKESFACISNAIRTLIRNGIDVKLYNFPICTVEPPFWTLCEKSISNSKVRFIEDCEFCSAKNTCSGIFSGTLQLEKEELKPIL